MDQSIDFKARALGSCTYGASWVVNSQLNAALIPNFCIFDGVNPVRTDYCDQARKAIRHNSRTQSVFITLIYSAWTKVCVQQLTNITQKCMQTFGQSL